MTETTTEPAKVVSVVPEGKDALDDLMVSELAIASRRLSCDVVEAVQEDRDGKRWDALPLVAWLWARRSDPQAKLTPFTELNAVDLWATLGVTAEDDDQAVEQLAGDDDELAGDDVDELETNPTEPAPAS